VGAPLLADVARSGDFFPEAKGIFAEVFPFEGFLDQPDHAKIGFAHRS
jgi:hypothetical protein